MIGCTLMMNGIHLPAIFITAVFLVLYVQYKKVMSIVGFKQFLGNGIQLYFPLNCLNSTWHAFGLGQRVLCNTIPRHCLGFNTNQEHF